MYLSQRPPYYLPDPFFLSISVYVQLINLLSAYVFVFWSLSVFPSSFFMRVLQVAERVVATLIPALWATYREQSSE